MSNRIADPSYPTAAGGSDASARKLKTLNLNTYKFHSLGDVVPTIRLFGTTDSYSTQTVSHEHNVHTPSTPADVLQPELIHRYPKSHYKRTSKRNISRQLSRIQMRQARIRKLKKQLLLDPDEEYRDEDACKLPYFIGKSQNCAIDLSAFHSSHRNDPAVKVAHVTVFLIVS